MGFGDGNVLEVAGAFLRLGLMSFGGPVAHLGYFRAEFVQKRKWLDDAGFADLVALCQFLPGPASSQTVFAIGMQRAGLIGAIAASVCFTLPSAILMIAFAYGVSTLGQLHDAGWVHGLKLAAVAVVAQAVWGLGQRLCPDRARLTLCMAAAAILLAVPGALMQVGIIAAGAIVGWWLYRSVAVGTVPAGEPTARGHLGAVAALLVFAALLASGPLLAASGRKDLSAFAGFYRAGSLVFGGGHVVLPLLRAEVVPRGWVSDDAFLAGYGAAQAVPGPLFTFSGYLGTVIFSGRHAWLGGVWCVLAMFLPGCLLIGGALPFWHRLRAKAGVQAALRGANAAVVGILLAALYNPVITQGVSDTRDAAAALGAFALLQYWRLSPWAMVIGMATTGQWVLR